MDVSRICSFIECDKCNTRLQTREWGLLSRAEICNYSKVHKWSRRRQYLGPAEYPKSQQQYKMVDLCPECSKDVA